jgi:AraC-like DNA-binding protein
LDLRKWQTEAAFKMADRNTRARSEWSRYFRLPVHSVEALHARFVTHCYPRHVHDYLVIGLVESGAQAYWYRGQRHITPAGQIFLVNPDEPHTGESATVDGYVYRTLYPRADLLARVVEDLGTGQGVPFFAGAVLNDPGLASLLSRLHQSLAEQHPKSECESLLFRALAHLIARHSETRANPKPAGSEREAVRKAREYLETNFSADVSLSELGALVSLSPFYLARAFEREIGLPPHAYLEGVRIRKAREILDRGSDLVSAALAVGYSDQSHLTRRFKRFLGITPGQYIRESKIRQDRLDKN